MSGLGITKYWATSWLDGCPIDRNTSRGWFDHIRENWKGTSGDWQSRYTSVQTASQLWNLGIQRGTKGCKNVEFSFSWAWTRPLKQLGGRGKNRLNSIADKTESRSLHYFNRVVYTWQQEFDVFPRIVFILSSTQIAWQNQAICNNYPSVCTHSFIKTGKERVGGYGRNENNLFNPRTNGLVRRDGTGQVKKGRLESV